MKFFWESDDKHFQRTRRKVLRWLKKWHSKIYKGDEVKHIGSIMGIDVPINRNDHLVVRNWGGVGAFVLVFDQHPGVAKFEWYKKDSTELLKRKIVMVVICSAEYAPLLSKHVDTVLAFPFTKVFNTETRAYSGEDGNYSIMTSLFEEKLYAFCKEKLIADKESGNEKMQDT